MPVVENNQLEVIEIEQEINSVQTVEQIEVVIDDLDLEVIEVSEQGPPGPIGPGGLGDFEQTFSALSSWVVNHNLGRRPLVSVTTMGGDEIGVRVLHTNDNQFVVYFDSPIAGIVRCI